MLNSQQQGLVVIFSPLARLFARLRASIEGGGIMSRWRFAVIVLALATVASAADLLVLSKNNEIRRYDPSGNFVGTNGSVYDPGGFDKAADGTIYVGSFGFAQLNKLDAAGNVLKTTDYFPRPEKVRLGNDGFVYLNKTDQSIVRVDPSTLGALGTVATTGASGDLRFGPDGLLYATTQGGIIAFDTATNTQVDFDPSTPAIDPFATMFLPREMAFGPDGHLFVIDFRTILRFDRPTRALLGEFIPAPLIGDPSPLSMVFGPDGNLYVSRDDNKIVRYDGSTGALLGTFIDDIQSGRPVEMMFVPEPSIALLAAFSLPAFRRRRA
jgi:sugar lactone lactonase YvrE